MICYMLLLLSALTCLQGQTTEKTTGVSTIAPKDLKLLGMEKALKKMQARNTLLEKAMTDMGNKYKQLENSFNVVTAEKVNASGEIAECKRQLLASKHLIDISSIGMLKKCEADLTNLQKNFHATKASLEKCRSVEAIYPQDCEAWRKAGYTKNGEYLIDPDGSGRVAQFYVECYMTSPAVTIVHHNSESRIQAGNCYTGSKCYSRTVTYTKAALSQIFALTSVSQKCEQFLKYECYNSYMRIANSYGAAWYDRSGRQMNYWPGAKPGSYGCACGETKSCDNPSYKCNCDYRDSRWHEDSGVLNDKSILPITKVAFGYTQSSYDGYHRIGPLRCFG